MASGPSLLSIHSSNLSLQQRGFEPYRADQLQSVMEQSAETMVRNREEEETILQIEEMKRREEEEESTRQFGEKKRQEEEELRKQFEEMKRREEEMKRQEEVKKRREEEELRKRFEEMKRREEEESRRQFEEMKRREEEMRNLEDVHRRFERRVHEENRNPSQPKGQNHRHVFHPYLSARLNRHHQKVWFFVSKFNYLIWIVSGRGRGRGTRYYWIGEIWTSVDQAATMFQRLSISVILRYSLAYQISNAWYHQGWCSGIPYILWAHIESGQLHPLDQEGASALAPRQVWLHASQCIWGPGGPGAAGSERFIENIDWLTPRSSIPVMLFHSTQSWEWKIEIVYDRKPIWSVRSNLYWWYVIWQEGHVGSSI